MFIFNFFICNLMTNEKLYYYIHKPFISNYTHGRKLIKINQYTLQFYFYIYLATPIRLLISSSVEPPLVIIDPGYINQLLGYCSYVTSHRSYSMITLYSAYFLVFIFKDETLCHSTLYPLIYRSRLYQTHVDHLYYRFFNLRVVNSHFISLVFTSNHLVSSYILLHTRFNPAQFSYLFFVCRFLTLVYCISESYVMIGK